MASNPPAVVVFCARRTPAWIAAVAARHQVVCVSELARVDAECAAQRAGVLLIDAGSDGVPAEQALAALVSCAQATDRPAALLVAAVDDVPPMLAQVVALLPGGAGVVMPDQVAERVGAQASLDRPHEVAAEFVRMAAHDLQQPLRGIGYLAQWIVEADGERLSEGALHDLERMQQRVERGRRLIDDLLTYTREGAVDDESFSVGDVLDSVLEELAIPDGFEVVRTAADDRLGGDRWQFGRVLAALLDNAIRHHPDTRGRIVVDVQRGSEDAMAACVVRDDGAGFASELGDEVWLPFRRGVTAARQPGSGLGLAIVRRLVERNGGEVRLDAAAGPGAAVWFSWPLAGGVSD